MSATASMVPSLGASSADDVSIVMGNGKRYTPWTQVVISRSCESLPNSFSLTAAGDFLQGAAVKDTQPDQPVSIYIGGDLLITGWLDRRVINLTAREHSTTLIGRGVCRDLVDCSADLLNTPEIRGAFINAPLGILDLAQKLCKAFKIVPVRIPPDPSPLPIVGLQIAIGETPFEILENAARYCGFILYENERGQLVIDQMATKTHASGFSVPGNVESVSAERNVDNRFTDTVVCWTTTFTLSDVSPLINQRTGVIKDGGVNGYRPHLIVSNQITPGLDFGERLGQWEVNRRRGRSQRVSLTCDSWRDSAGKLWTPNQLVQIDMPSCDIVNARWTIGTVTFRKDASGTHADIVAMPPEAFSPEPAALVLFDNQLQQKTGAPQSPAPPSTNPR